MCSARSCKRSFTKANDAPYSSMGLISIRLADRSMSKSITGPCAQPCASMPDRAIRMNPFNSPNGHCDGDRVEVRVSRDILVPIEVLKSLRYVKRDGMGRIEKALFEPSAEVRIKEQIDIMLRDIEKKHWKE